ncbi:MULTISPECIES: glycosyltransferase family 4 protein [unclassified Pseudoalteromonas]|uniref:glycosyltransferase family 4 protein n=1 Tax=unclassified Pseudoalteromonas TaxID=194690 RepID=UPI000978221A|nr:MULTISPECIES: glycosyltransferase family 4 protein [unclassified Pseudoalteromonas]PLT24031.1 glycosyl transferase family 1 [Pseudoalteromonas sp. MelDa3]
MDYRVILFVDSSMIGGIETHLIEISKLLAKNNVPSIILFYKDHGNKAFYTLLDNESIKYDFAQGNVGNFLKKLRQYNEKIVIHTHGYKAGIVARVVCKLYRYHCVSTYHAGETGEGRVRFYNKIDKLLSFLSINFAVSDNIAKSIKNSTLLENFISIPSETKPKQITKALKVGFVGRLSHEKGPDIFCKLSSMMQADARIQFHVFGDGPLKNDVTNSQNIKYHGLTNRNNIWEHLDVLLICSREEGLPMTLLEAISENTLIVSSPVGAIPTIIKNKKNGFLMTKGNIEDCKHNLDLILKMTPQQKVIMLETAKKMLEERFSGKKQFALLDKAYRKE